MQIRLFPRELMMVSSATAVLPVWRSPMMSSRCPRPIGIIESMDTRDAVTERDDRADFVDRNLRLVVLDLLANYLCDLVCFDSSHKFLFASSFQLSAFSVQPSWARWLNAER